MVKIIKYELNNLTKDGPMISKNFALNISSCLSGKPFTLDELIMETKLLFDREGIPGFLRLLLSFIDNIVLEDSRVNPMKNCCSSPKLNKNGKRSKKIYSTIGNLNFEWTTMRCTHCNHLHHPLKDFLGLEKYQKITNEFERICIETVAKESFRRSTDTIKTHTPTDFNFRTLHRWFIVTDSSEISVRHDDLIALLADGTGYKKFISQNKLERENKIREKTGQAKVEKSKRGEVKILMGIKENNEVIPLGAWTSESWKVVGRLIDKANNPNKKIAHKKMADVLIADGEIGLNMGLKRLTNHQQRCLWHIPHELKPLMKYQEKAKEEDVKYTLSQVHSIFQIEIPDKDFDTSF